MVCMGNPIGSRRKPTEPDAEAGVPPGSVGGVDNRVPGGGEAARVAAAAAELGVSVPEDFRLLGRDADGRHIAACYGGPAVMRMAAAILYRLDGAPVAECLARMKDTAQEPGPEPAWAPPTDWTDTDALLAYLAELERHPEWPRFYNGGGDWIAMLGGIGAVAGAAATVLNLRTRRAFAQYVIDQAVRQGATIDPVAVIRAFERSQPAGSVETGDRGTSDSAESGADDEGSPAVMTDR
jgi:hypothetical protein